MQAFHKTTACATFIIFTIAQINCMEYCPPGWMDWNQSCYMITPRPMLWRDVHQLCRSFGARMAVPSSDGENQFISDVALKLQSPLWIDCTDKDNEGMWVCSEDVSPGTGYRQFSPGQPNDYPGEADFAQMNTNYRRTWSDQPDKLTFSMCEMKKTCSSILSCQAANVVECN